MSKKHHYVPRSLLENFSVKGKRQQVCVFDKKKESSYATNVRDAGSENHFNTITVEGRRFNFEGEFQRCDDELARIVRKLVRSRSLSVLSEQERDILAQIASIQMLRVKIQRTTFVEMTNQIRHLIESTGADVSEEVLPDIDDNDARQITLQQLRNAGRFVPHFLEKNWLLHATAEISPFWISDNPIVTQNVFPYGDSGLASKGVEICFPLSSTLLLSFACPTIVNKTEEHSREHADFLRSEPTIACKPPAVLHYNSLQVLQSSRFVYGPTRQFNDARRIVKENPDIREQLSTMGAPVMGKAPTKQRMPDGCWLVAYGIRTHHMVSIDDWQNWEGGLRINVTESNLDAARTMLRDGPYSLVEIYRNQTAGRGMRDVTAQEVPSGSGTIEIRHSDPAMHNLARKIDETRQ